VRTWLEAETGRDFGTQLLLPAPAEYWAWREAWRIPRQTGEAEGMPIFVRTRPAVSSTPERKPR
jgi:hypothetical protein